MNAAPRLHQPDEPPAAPRWSVAPSWLAAGLVIAGSLGILTYTGSVVMADARRAAEECRRAAERIEAANAERDRQFRAEQALRKTVQRQAAEILALQREVIDAGKAPE